MLFALRTPCMLKTLHNLEHEHTHLFYILGEATKYFVALTICVSAGSGFLNSLVLNSDRAESSTKGETTTKY